MCSQLSTIIDKYFRHPKTPFKVSQKGGKVSALQRRSIFFLARGVVAENINRENWGKSRVVETLCWMFFASIKQRAKLHVLISGWGFILCRRENFCSHQWWKICENGKCLAGSEKVISVLSRDIRGANVSICTIKCSEKESWSARHGIPDENRFCDRKFSSHLCVRISSHPRRRFLCEGSENANKHAAKWVSCNRNLTPPENIVCSCLSGRGELWN